MPRSTSKATGRRPTPIAIGPCDIFRERCTGVHWERNTATAFGLWALSHMGEIAELGRRWPRLLAEARDRGDLYAVMNLSTYLLSIVRLAADEPDRAREEVGQAMAHWSRGGYHVQHNDQAWGMAQIELYAGRGGAAWDLIAWNWPALSRSLLLRVQFIRVAMWQLRARCAWRRRSVPTSLQPLLRAAAADARRLEREATPWSLASARLVRAALAWNRGGDARRSRSPDRRRRAIRRHSHGSRRGRGPAAAGRTGRRRPGRDARRAGRRLDARSGDPRARPHDRGLRARLQSPAGRPEVTGSPCRATRVRPRVDRSFATLPCPPRGSRSQPNAPLQNLRVGGATSASGASPRSLACSTRRQTSPPNALPVRVSRDRSRESRGGPTHIGNFRRLITVAASR